MSYSGPYETSYLCTFAFATCVPRIGVEPSGLQRGRGEVQDEGKTHRGTGSC
jgi:hypothetical protein